MQLKRDTDYALRIMLCLTDQCLVKQTAPNGLSMLDISALTGIHKLSAERICGDLVRGRFIIRRTGKGREVRFLPREGLGDASLLEVVTATENSADLFAVFDRRARPYQRSGALLRHIEEQSKELLSQTTIHDLLDGSIQGHRLAPEGR